MIYHHPKQFQEIMKLPHSHLCRWWLDIKLLVHWTFFFFFLVSISLAFLQRLLTWDADSCSIHLSTSLVNTFSSGGCYLPEPATASSLLLVPISLYLCLYWWLLSTSAGPLAHPLCPATGHCPPLTLGLTLCLCNLPFFLCHLFVWGKVGGGGVVCS